MKRLVTALALLAVTATASSAAGSFLALQFQSGTADLALENSGYAAAYDHSEWGGKIECWKMMADDYAVTFAGTYSLFGEEDQAGQNAPANSPAFRYTQKAFALRLGGDRMVKLGERNYIFFGPGVEYWSGKAKFEFDGTSSVTESKNVTRISLSGRLGAHMMMSDAWGFTLQGGHKVGYANYKEAGAKTTWWPSSMDASGGLVFHFD